MPRFLAFALLLASVSCAPGATALATPADLAVRSADDPEDNRAGLVTAATLTRWLTDWPASRPEGISGDLVVLQLDEATGPGRFLRSGPGVRAYHAADLPLFNEARSNGVVAVGAAPATGTRIDRLLRRYGVNPSRDLVVLASATGSLDSLRHLARTWLALRYWGFEHRALAVLADGLEGGVPAALRGPDAAAAPFDGTARVVGLPEHFALLASLGDVRAAVGSRPLLDVRSAEAHAGGRLEPSTRDATCLEADAGCTPTFSGRIAGAVHLPLEALLQPGTSRPRPPRELDAALARAGLGATGGELIVYDGDGDDSAVATFLLLAVAGVPARWYAGSFLEWGALNGSHPEAGLRLLPEDSPWRTDVFPALTGGETRWGSTAQALRPLLYDARAPFADRLLTVDRQYRLTPPELPAVSATDTSCR